MGLFFGEKIFKSIIHIFLFSLIVMLPFTLSLIVNNDISNKSYRSLEQYLMEESINTDLQITNGNLIGTKGVAFLIEEAIIFINPLDEPLEVDSEYELYHVIELNPTGLNVSLFDETIYSKSYVDLGVGEIDFRKIEEADYIELDKMVSLVNIGFVNMKAQFIMINSLMLYIDIIITALFSALILAFIIKFINPFIGFKLRFKGALDAQFISLLCLLLMILFQSEVFRYIGIVLSSIYLFKAMLSIVRIEVKKNAFKDKEEEE
jgi:hypothetical protein